MKFFWLPVIAIAFVSVASSAPLTSATTITTGSITANDFSCSFQPMSSGTVNGDCSNISVAAGTPGTLLFTNGITTSGIGTPDAQVALAVTSTTLITTVGLSFTVTINGPEILDINEQVFAQPYSASESPLANFTVICYAASAGITTCSNYTNPTQFGGSSVGETISGDTVTLTASIPASTSLYILKDVGYDGTSTGSVGDITSFSQFFGPEVTTAEPITLLLFGSGLALFGLLRLRCRKKPR